MQPHPLFARRLAWPAIISDDEIPSSNSMALSSQNLELWVLSLETARPHLSHLVRVLDVAENARASCFRLENDAHRFQICRAVLRLLLGSYTQVPSGDIAFRFNEHGKPILRHAKNSEKSIHFNLSHAANYAVFAFAKNPVGIDIEYSMSSNNIEEMIALCLTMQEIKSWLATPKPQQRRRFFEIWTAKEAFLKKLGCGLSTPMNQWPLNFENAPDDADASLVVFSDFTNDKYVCSVACASRVPRIIVREISSAVLLRLLQRPHFRS